MATQPDADGWIEWTGGKCPVAPRDRVECRLGNGAHLRPALASRRDWRAYSGVLRDYQIIAYRLVQP